MSAPRHLWSGDWQRDSATAAEELAKRRGQAEGSDEAPLEPSAPASGPSAAARMVARLRSVGVALGGRDRELRAALIVASLVLVTAVTAFGVTLLVNGSGGQSSAAMNRAHAWLGIDVAGSPSGVVVTVVVAGSPAQAAGLQPGDLIAGIDNQPVGTVDSVNAALSGLSAGSRILIQFSRGPTSFTTQATLTTRPPGAP